MKKLLSILLCISMLITLVPFGAFAAEESDRNALELFGFPLDPDSYDTHALKKGTYPVSPKYDLYVDNYSQIRKYTGSKYTNSAGTIYTRMTDSPSSFTNKENVPYSAVTGFSASGTGVEDYIAKAYFPYGRRGANICLSIYDAKGNNIVKGYETGGYVYTTDDIEMWEVEGLLSITAGDFDGDSVDEIAVYTPNNATEVTKGGHNNISVGIYEFDKASKTLSTKQYIDLSSKKDPSEICEWEYSYNGNKPQFYCLPYIALTTEDFNKDNIDDLSAIVNFSTWFRGAGGWDTYSTKQILADPISSGSNENRNRTNFASVLEVYEGKEGGGFNQSIRHKMLVTDALKGGGSDANAEHRYVLRNANLTVGDVTQEGSREIIIAGNYTRVDVKSTSSDAKVGSNRFVEVDGDNALCSIVGYTSYDNLKKHNVYDKNGDYHWTVQKTGNGWGYWYNEDSTDSGPITVPLESFKYYGTGHHDMIFVGGQLFEYNNDEGKLKFLYNYNGDGKLFHGSNGKYRETSVTWFGGATAGNFGNDIFGREVLVFPFYYKVSGEAKLSCKLLTFGEATANTKPGGVTSQISQIRYVFEDVGERIVSLALLDGGGKTSYITYPGNDTEVYYTDVEALAIMQAPPLYEELNDDNYIGNSATGFAKSEGSGSGTSKGGTFSLGVVAGFEYDGSFLGLIPCAGAEYEFSLTGSVSKEKSVEKTYTYTTGFEAMGLTDAVTVFTVPYVRYNCSMYVPEYKLPTEEDYKAICKFRDELAKNIANYEKTGESQEVGTFVKGSLYYLYKYSSYVCEDNYQEQIGVLKKLADEAKFIEDAIASFGKGGTGKWGDTVAGAILPYHYNVPQNPLLTTVDVATYDSIAEFTPGLEKIYGNVFDENYRMGDPNTYAHKIGDLNAVDGDVLQSKQAMGSSSDGFLTNSSVSSSGTAQTQVIAVEESDSSTIGWGVAVENTSVAKVSVAKAGFTVSAEHNSSYVTTTTKGQEYSGTVVSLPENTPDDYSYDWKVVSYMAKLNGSKVPVVGYLTRINKTPPPSIAQNIKVTDITDTSATITWENGARPADYYSLSKILVTNGEERTANIEPKITSEDGNFSYTLKGLSDNTQHKYVLESFMNTGKYSVPTDRVIITTFPKDFSASIELKGINNSVIYRNGKAFDLSVEVTGNDGYNTYYQWELDTGDGWNELRGQNKKDYKFTISPIDNGKRVRCSAVVEINENSSYVLYTEPVVMNCARSDNGYEVDWEDNTIKVTKPENAQDSTMFVRVSDADGSVIKVIEIDGEADLSEYLGKGYNLRLFIVKENLSPVSKSFER